MLKQFPGSVTPWLPIVVLLGALSACQSQDLQTTRPTDNPSSTSAATASSQLPASSSGSASSSAASTSSSSQSDPYQQAIERASSAYTIGRSAQSGDDWKLVANRWKQAIELMKAVPASNSRHRQAQQKLLEYQQHLSHAQKQASRPVKPQNPDGVIVLPSTVAQVQPARPQSQLPAAQPAPAAPSPAAPTGAQSANPSAAPQVFRVPITRRAGNTPVVQVMFNGSQPFDMIVDTGASGTLITRQMANALGVVPVSQANVNTASQKNVTFPLGYVQSMELGGARANNLLVAIAGPELDIGLLGHDFFGRYDVTIREQEVEFRERQ